MGLVLGRFRRTWPLYRGGHLDEGNRLATFVGHFLAAEPGVSITLKGSRGASAFKIRGELGATSFQVSRKLPCGGEVAVAAAERRQMPLSQRGSVAASSDNSSTYDVLLEAGADAAFVAAACIVIDSMYNKSQRYQE
ncbi:hypothetical protein MNEG_16472 [Monoraphidium neglectum]|uniref:Uncharacterized protein n=1 Tax=Monoraphidium neglectum TaxID=145388 RepID=A0A0D2K5N9_9CHLO|nr:hypothetical protein MNEG_16472 [Monoraphidium neglectum]KIY91493.1 hypothetical protein MNEG_16472 [Monoraphidium neglectum]|eukprot:XP_013890513.1 hypothetical protein MNEG_16472 [Monoraphidium neglectum]